MAEILSSSIFYRGMCRIIICAGGILSIYLGYKLYKFGIADGLAKVGGYFAPKLGPKVGFVVSGTGPGLFLIVFGATILISALYIGGAKSTRRIEQVIAPGKQAYRVLDKNEQEELEELKKFKENTYQK